MNGRNLNSGPGGYEEPDIGGESDDTNKHSEQPTSPADRTEHDNPKSNERDQGDGWCAEAAPPCQHVTGDRRKEEDGDDQGEKEGFGEIRHSRGSRSGEVDRHDGRLIDDALDDEHPGERVCPDR